MQKTYFDFINEIQNKKIMFCGIGKSNIPFINMLAKQGIAVTAYDSKSSDKININITKELSQSGLISMRLGDESVWGEKWDIIVRTPGMSYLNPKLQKSKAAGSAVTSEMEIFFDLCPCPIIGITGSDGKTTVTSIIGQMLKNSGFNVHIGGNIGKPLLPEIKHIQKSDIAVTELSSFQLASMRKSPDIAVITNISPNHLDVHKDMHEYIEAKKQIIYHQNAFSKAILNYDNTETRRIAEFVRGKVIFFSRKEKLSNGVWINSKNEIIISENKKDTTIMNISDIKIPGNHNIENYLAAIACVYGMVSAGNILETAQNFGGVPHRIEFVRNLNGVSYYNDSIASSPTRTICGTLSLFKENIILIAGGYDKNIPFDELAEQILQKVSVLILLGATSQKIEKAILNSKNYNPQKLVILKASSMQSAVTQAKNIAKSGDKIILSPACASFDLYENFEKRGDCFKNIVNSLN